MAYAFVTGAHGVNAGNVTGLDTTGADLLIAVVSYYAFGTAPDVTDNKGNTFTALTGSIDAPFENGGCKIFYCRTTSVGSSHDFTLTASFGSLAVAAFSGSASSSTFDREAGTPDTFATSISSGSITPDSNDELVIAGLSTHITPGTITINSSFNITDVNNAGSNYCVGLAYLIQTSAGAANPTWSWDNINGAAARIASFRAAGGGGGGGSSGVHSHFHYYASAAMH